MSTEAVTPSPEGSTEAVTTSVAPTDFRDYAAWRKTGELPAQDETPPAAAADVDPSQATTEPQSGADADQHTEDEGDDEPEGKPNGRPGGRQRKIDKLTRELTELRTQIAQLKQPAQPDTAAKPAAAAAAPNGKPKLEDFTTLEDYQEALTDWKMDQRETQQKTAQAEQALRAAEEKINAAWQTSVKATRAAHSDYEDIVGSIAEPEGPGVLAVRRALFEDANGAEILYYLGKHPAELKAIAAMQPYAAVKEIGKIAARFETDSGAETPKPRVSSAPKPPPPSGRTGRMVSDDLNDPAVQQDFKRWAKARTAQSKG